MDFCFRNSKFFHSSPDDIDIDMLQDNAGHVVIQAPPPVLTGVPVTTGSAAAVTATNAVHTTNSPPTENNSIFLYESSANTYLSQVL